MLSWGRRPALAALLAVMINSSSCSWRATDQALFASYSIFSAVDAFQTSMITERGLREGNPLFANEDGSPDMTRVVIMKTLGTGLIFWLLDSAEEGRTELLAIANTIQGGVVVWNGYWLEHAQNIVPSDLAYKSDSQVYFCPQLKAHLLVVDQTALAECEKAALMMPNHSM